MTWKWPCVFSLVCYKLIRKTYLCHLPVSFKGEMFGCRQYLDCTECIFSFGNVYAISTIWWTSNKLHNCPLKTYRKAAPLKDCISIYLNCTLQLILKKYMKMLYYKKNISVLCGGQSEDILVCTFPAFFHPFILILRTTTMRFSPVGKRYEPSLEGLLKDCSALLWLSKA